MSDKKKGIGRLSRIEKRIMYGGDKTILAEKMGLVEEEDIEKYRKKLGLKKGFNFTNVEDVEEFLEENKE
jgi:hypothetical protein